MWKKLWKDHLLNEKYEDHAKKKRFLLGQGEGYTKEPFDCDIPFERSKSAPPGFGGALEEDKIEGGKADNEPDENFDQDQLEKGIKIEREHTDDPEIATEITKDHLKEFDDYYDRLIDMEKEAKKEKLNEEGNLSSLTDPVENESELNNEKQQETTNFTIKVPEEEGNYNNTQISKGVELLKKIFPGSQSNFYIKTAKQFLKKFGEKDGMTQLEKFAEKNKNTVSNQHEAERIQKDLTKELTFESFETVLKESGIRNINQMAKQYAEAEIWFHIDLDGVTSAIAAKEYLKQYGIKTVKAETIQYGDQEYTISEATPGLLHVLVDFSHGKPAMNIHTDHHQNQTGIDDPMLSKKFSTSYSNVSDISGLISTSDVFDLKDIEVINIVDAARYSLYNLTPSDVPKAVYKLSKENLNVNVEKIKFGLIVNKWILSYKNKKDFLSEIVMKSSPSLKNIYLHIRDWVTQHAGLKYFATGKDIEKNYEFFKDRAKDSGKIGMTGNVVWQDGLMTTAWDVGSYDRYVAFDIYPQAHWLCVKWPMGLIQITKNPFKKEKNPYNLGEIGQKILNKFKPLLSSIKVGVGDIKLIYEEEEIKKRTKGNNKNIIGFTYKDLINTFHEKAPDGATISRIRAPQSYSSKKEEAIRLMNKFSGDFSTEEIRFLNGIYITAWDFIQKSSGGHKDITNLSGFNFLKNYKLNKLGVKEISEHYLEILDSVWKECIQEMSEKNLVKEQEAFINELFDVLKKNNEKPIISKAYVFDFDDTLVKSDVVIYVKTQDNKIISLTPAEFAKYVPSIGDEFDFKDFVESVLDRNPRINSFVVKDYEDGSINIFELFKQKVAEQKDNVFILTARSTTSKLNVIEEYLKEQNINFNTNNIQYLADANPLAKKDWIKNNLFEKFNEIDFFDDSIKNVKAVSSLKDGQDNVKIMSYKIEFIEGNKIQ
ncbi:hypothetical protein M0R19_03885 [Candidatus Pacearchaeota archaeon]|nr:hypothetical protein [Candidatus Pacearchaeota archaeon]